MSVTSPPSARRVSASATSAQFLQEELKRRVVSLFLLELARDGHQLLEVFDPAFRLDRAFVLKRGNQPAALEHRLEQLGDARAGARDLAQLAQRVHEAPQRLGRRAREARYARQRRRRHPTRLRPASGLAP